MPEPVPHSKLRCSAVLCVRNEINRLEQGLMNILALPLDEVIVVDGGSDDGTWEALLMCSNLNAYQAGHVGLLNQRLQGIWTARNDVVLLVDIDDDIPEAGLRLAFAELESDTGIDGVGFIPQSVGKSWFALAWSKYVRITNPRGSRIKILGRPCLTYRTHYESIEAPADKIFSDDLWLKLNSPEESQHYITSQANSFRSFPEGFVENCRKFRDYGISDHLVGDNPDKRRDLLFHALWRVAVIRTLRMLLDGDWRYAFFPLLHGVVRGTTHIWAAVKGKKV